MALAVWSVAVFGLDGLVERTEAVLIDGRMRLAGPRPPPRDPVVVRIDARTLEAAGGWPLDRRFWTDVVAEVGRAGARTIVLDALLAAGAKAPSAGDDAALATALVEHGRVVLALGVGAGVPAPEALMTRLAYPVLTATAPAAAPMPVAVMPRVTAPPSDLAAAAAGLAPSLIGLSAYGGPPVLQGAVHIDERALPTLAVEAVRVHLGVDRARLWFDAERGVLVDGRPLARAEGGAYRLLPYGPAGVVTVVDGLEVLAGNVDLSDRLVVVGVDAPAAGERFRTAFSPSLSGVELLATFIANLLEGRALERLPLASGGGFGLTLLAAAAAACVVGRGRVSVALLTLALVIAAWLAAVHLAFVLADLWVPAAVPLTAAVLAAVAVEAARLVLVQRAERALAIERQNLARFFPPSLAERLAGSSELATLDRSLEATIMFVDLVGSSAMVERLAPPAVLAEYRRMSGRIEEIVFAEGGTLVSFLGDGALVAFGAPEPSADAPRAALRAACRLAERFADDPLVVSIGLHHGPVVAGNVGGTRQFQYAVTGDTVHVASRLEGLSRDLNAVVVASSVVLAAAGDAKLAQGFIAAGSKTLRGRALPVEVVYMPRKLQRQWD